MMSNGPVLLMTSCINPQGMKFTKLQDKMERRRQYEKALSFYLANTSLKIVYCDNSGEEIEGLIKNMDDSRIELLSFNGNNYDVCLGKGYGELEIIRYAMDHSRFLKNAKSVIKVTGRLIVKNLCEVTRLNYRLFCRPEHFIFANELTKPHEFDSRCFYASLDFLSCYFLNQPNTINDTEGRYFEHFLYDSIKSLPTSFVVSGFVLPLVVNGVSGSTGSQYDDKQLNRLEKSARIRDFCQYEKRRFKGENQRIYRRIRCVSSLARIKKALLVRFI